VSKALFGSCDPTTLAANAPDVDLGEFADVKLEQVHIYSALFEIPLHGAMRSLPVGVHPSIPALSCATFWRCPGRSAGRFRAGLHRAGVPHRHQAEAARIQRLCRHRRGLWLLPAALRISLPLGEGPTARVL
jgi:hypothetical protein